MFIAIEGVLGVGKTTLQQLLLTKLEAVELVQQFEPHPYLAKYYQEPERYAVEKEFVFLFMAYHQLRRDLFPQGGIVLSDFVFDKCEVFARTTLSGEWLDGLFLPTASFLRGYVASPDVLIFLRGSSNKILTRIRARGREMEKGIMTEQIDRLAAAYDSVLPRMTSRVIRVNIDDVDFLSDPTALQWLLTELSKATTALLSGLGG